MLTLKNLPKVQKIYRQYARLKGFGLFSSMLALAVLSIIVLLIAEQVSEYDFRQRQKTVALDLARLTEATIDRVTQDFKSFEASVVTAGGIRALTVQDLITSDTLQESFAQTNDVGQTYAIYVRTPRRGSTRGSAGKLDILVTTITPATIPISYNLIAMSHYNGNGYIGIVSPRAPNYLAGPGLRADITPYRAIAQAPELGETAVITHLTANKVFDDFMYRKAQPGHDDATKMETDLDLGDHNLVGVGEIKADTLTIEQQLEVLGGVNVIGDLVVGTRASGAGGSLTVNGPTTVTSLTATTATFGSARIDEKIEATSTTITNDITVEGTLQASRGDFREEVTARTLTAVTLNAGTLNSLHIEVEETATIKDLVADRLIVEGEVQTKTAIINHLSVQKGCTGC